MHKKFFLTAGFLLLATSPARAQQISGTYTMSVGGKAVSAENYTMVAEPDGALRAEAEVPINGGKQKMTTALSNLIKSRGV
jgi:hypothetical protein